MREKIKNILIIFSFIFLLFPSLSFAEDKKQAYYFYSNACPHCQNVEEYFQENKIYEKYKITKLEVSSRKNLELLKNFLKKFGVNESGIPVVVFENSIITGDKLIIRDFENKISEVEATKLPIPSEIENDFDKKRDLKLSVLIGAALVDAFNPCAFAVLVILIATVVGARGRKNALYSGLLFALAIFASYFLMGLGLYKAITVFNLPKIISIVVGVLAILIGLANLKDAFWHGKGFLMEVPMSWRPKMKSILRSVTSPVGALGAGFLVSLFLLPCTSGPYIVILGLLAEKVDLFRAISLLALYNLIFISPMIVITLLMYFGVRMKKVEEIRVKNINLLHGVAGVIMLVIGVYLIYSWV